MALGEHADLGAAAERVAEAGAGFGARVPAVAHARHALVQVVADADRDAGPAAARPPREQASFDAGAERADRRQRLGVADAAHPRVESDRQVGRADLHPRPVDAVEPPEGGPHEPAGGDRQVRGAVAQPQSVQVRFVQLLARPRGVALVGRVVGEAPGEAQVPRAEHLPARREVEVDAHVVADAQAWLSVEVGQRLDGTAAVDVEHRYAPASLSCLERLGEGEKKPDLKSGEEQERGASHPTLLIACSSSRAAVPSPSPGCSGRGHAWHPLQGGSRSPPR